MEISGNDMNSEYEVINTPKQQRNNLKNNKYAAKTR